MTLVLSPRLSLPNEAVTKKLAFIGMSGSGKTFASGLFVEELSNAGAQVVVVDVIGNWWGLRLAADGKGKGIPIYVFGGERGDVPLEPTGGKLVADTIVDTGVSVVLDISDFLQGEQRRFVADFATQLLRRKKRARSPIHVIWEECQDVVPEYAPGDVARCVGAVSRLAKQGRNHGVGSTFITQRPQAVAKEVLNQVECLFMFHIEGSQEEDALQKWVGRSMPKGSLDELKMFADYECLVWSPSWLQKKLEKIKFRKKWTFDASATPKFGSKETTIELRPLDLDKVSKAMAETLERAKDNDPAALRAEIGRLKAELVKKPAAAPVRVEKVEVPVVDNDDMAELARLSSDLGDVATEANSLVSTADALKRSYNGLAARVDELLARIGDRHASGRRHAADPVPPHFDVSTGEEKAPPHFHVPTAPARPQRATFGDPTGGQALRAGARRMLEAVAALHPRPVTRAQVAMLAGLAAGSGTFASYLSDLRRAEFIAEPHEGIVLTREAIASLGAAGKRVGGGLRHEDLVAMWMPKMRAGARKMLEVVIAAYPQDMTRAELAAAAGLEPGSGTFASYLSDLRTSGCMQDTARGRVRATDTLFPS